MSQPAAFNAKGVPRGTPSVFCMPFGDQVATIWLLIRSFI